MWRAVVALALVALSPVRASNCNESFVLAPGNNVTISLPIDPATGLYYKNYTCQKVFTYSNYRVSFILACPDFKVRRTRPNCKKSDHLYVTDNITVFPHFCGRKKPGLVMSGGPYLLVQFKSQTFGKAGKGFNCTVNSTEDMSYSSSTTTVGPARLADPRAEPVPPPFVPKKGYKCVCGETRVSRIIGGTAADVHEYPWTVTLSPRGVTEPLCTGVLINDRHVLTAATCVQDSSDLQVRLAETDLSKVSRSIIRDVVVLRQQNGLAVLNFTRPVNLGSKLHPMRPVCLPDDTTNFASQTAILTGFGGVRTGDKWSPNMNEISVPLASSCSTAGQLCSNVAIALCDADSGSPIVVQQEGRAVLAGVVPSLTTCASVDKFVDVKQQLNWLRDVIADGVTCRYTHPPTTTPAS